MAFMNMALSKYLFIYVFPQLEKKVGVAAYIIKGWHDRECLREKERKFCVKVIHLHPDSTIVGSHIQSHQTLHTCSALLLYLLMC